MLTIAIGHMAAFLNLFYHLEEEHEGGTDAFSNCSTDRCQDEDFFLKAAGKLVEEDFKTALRRE